MSVGSLSFFQQLQASSLIPCWSEGGLRARRVYGSYSSTSQQNYRCILQNCEMSMHEVSPEQSIELWVEEHLGEIREFFNTHKGSKGAILVNSVAAAKRLVALLKEYFRDQPEITIGENTGLTSRQERLAWFGRLSVPRRWILVLISRSIC